MKILLILAFLFFTGTNFAGADQPVPDDETEIQQMIDSLKSEDSPLPQDSTSKIVSTRPSDPAGKLVDMDMSRVLVRLNDLEQQVRDLDRENRLQTEQIRSVERSVDSLKRRV